MGNKRTIKILIRGVGMKCPIHNCKGIMKEYSTPNQKLNKTYICPKCSTIMTIPKGLKTSPDSNENQSKGHDKGD